MAHKHSVYDSDTHFSINPITRTIKNESSSKTTLMQYDHNSERITFEIPRYIEEHDMSLCNMVQVHYINIDVKTKAENAGVYAVEDMQISPESDDVVICSWLVSRNATLYAGSLSFILLWACVGDGGIVEYAWNTAKYTGISISDGINNGDIIEEEYSDVLAEWEMRIAALEEGGGGGNSAKLDAYQGIANAGKLLYVGEDGTVALLQLGTGVEIIDGRLCITGAVEPGEPSGLPGVSDADNGKVLTVVGGKWAAKELPKYEGVYIITPSADKEQTLRTAQRLLDADVTVKPIPYYEMDNGSEGTTVYIGSETEIIME